MRDTGMRSLVAVVSWLVLALVVSGIIEVDAQASAATRSAPSTTVLFYMNGDNNLTDEVLSTIDRMERVGSSKDLNIVALVDGHPAGISRFGKQWSGTRLLHITSDHHTARIASTVLADWGEQDLGHPETLTRFVRAAVERFPADRYIFCAFAHGKGVIDTGNLMGRRPGPPAAKSLSISSDDTSDTIMPLSAFGTALDNGLDGRRFSLTVLFSCLSGMVEIAYGLTDVTDYLIASEDEIRLVNEPPGTHQLSGISFEDLLQQLKADPEISDIELGRSIIDRYIEPYMRPICTLGSDGRNVWCRYPAGLALIDCRNIKTLASNMDELADELIGHLNSPDRVVRTLADVQDAMDRAQRFKSFLNLEYYDLPGWLDGLVRNTGSEQVLATCRKTAIAFRDTVVYERHTQDLRAGGMAVYFSHYLVPQNVFLAHQKLYGQTRFGQHTRWDELIRTYQDQVRRYKLELLHHQAQSAYHRRDMDRFHRVSKQAIRELNRRIRDGRRDGVDAFVTFLKTLPPVVISPDLVDDLHSSVPMESTTRPARSVSE